MNTERFVHFKKFLDKEIFPATSDLEKLDDSSRKHVQKLVYTNLVDRFDSMIDGAILDNCREECLVKEASKSLTQPIIEPDLIRLLMHSENIQAAGTNRFFGKRYRAAQEILQVSPCQHI